MPHPPPNKFITPYITLSPKIGTVDN